MHMRRHQPILVCRCWTSLPEQFLYYPQWHLLMFSYIVSTVATVLPRLRTKIATSCLVIKLCLTLCDPMDQSMPGPPVFHCLQELDQIHVGSFSDNVQPSRPLMSPSPLAFTLSQHQCLFQGVFSSHQMAKVLEPQFQDLSFQWGLGVDYLQNG